MAQLDAEQEFVIDYTPGLTKGKACEDADGMMEMIKCSMAYRVAKAQYENAQGLAQVGGSVNKISGASDLNLGGSFLDSILNDQGS